MSESRYRIPDLMVLGPGYPIKTIALYPPALIIEILSEDDTWEHLVAKCQEYVSFGSAATLIADPYGRRVYRVIEAGAEEIVSQRIEFAIEGTAIAIDSNQLFAKLDRD